MSTNKKIKILHLEDNTSDAEQIARVVSKSDIVPDIKVVDTRLKYIKALTEFMPDIVISDHHLPAFDSLEALMLLRRSNLVIPFVLVTGTVSEEFAVEAMRAGADDYILKDRLQRLPVSVHGVLERYKLERQRQRTETLLRNIDSNSLDMICSVSEDGYFLHVSAACEMVLGYTAEELIGKRIFEFTYPEDREKTIQSANKVMEGKLLKNFENRYVKKDGTVVTLSWSARWDDVERIRYGVARDVTEKKKAEEKIRLAETLLRNIDTNSLDVICTIDREGIFTYVSQASTKVLGYTPEELVGTNYKRLVYEDDQDSTKVTDAQLLLGNDVTMFENRYVRKDGSRVTLLWSSHYESKDQIIYCVAKDVTELKKAERVIAAERKRLSDLFMNAPVSMCITSGKDHVFELANPIYLELAGKKDIIGKAGAEVFPELATQGLMELLGNIYDSGQPFKANEMEFKIDRDGTGKLSELYQNVLQQPYRDVDGNVAGLFYFGIDVTEQVLARKKIEEAERAVVAERKQLSQLITNAPVSMCILNGEHHTFELVNPIFIKLFGNRDYLNRPAREVFPEIEGQGFFEIIDEVYKTGTPYSVDETIVKIDVAANGQLTDIYLNLLFEPYFDADAKVKGIFYFGVDVTEQVLTRKKIEESEQRYRQIVETAQEGIWVIDEHDITTFVNTKLCNILGYSREEMMGKEFAYFMDEEGKQLAADFMQKKKSGQTCQDQIKYISKTGAVIWTHVSANPLFKEDGVYGGALSMVTDITQQKKIENILVRRDNQLTLAAQIAGLGYWEYDIQTDIFTFNDQFYDVFKTTADAVGGYCMNSARYAELFVHPEDAPLITKSVTDAIESVDTNFSFKAEHRIIYANGEIGFVHVHFRTTKDEQGRAIKNFGVTQDITERKKVELERLALIDGLQNKNKDLQQFSYIVSHNLRAPIAKIMGLVSVMESESEENMFLLEKLTEEAAHLDDVVKDINTIVSARKSSREKMETVSFKTEFNLIKQVLEEPIAESNATIREDFSAAPQLWTIKSYLYSIVYNLVSNALKYRKPNVPLHIEISSFETEKFIGLSVKDNGEGIDLVKNGNKVFGLYKRFHTGNVPGKGIGLSLVKTHAESLGGYVEIESELNIGTTFRIYIPKHDGKNE